MVYVLVWLCSTRIYPESIFPIFHVCVAVQCALSLPVLVPKAVGLVWSRTLSTRVILTRTIVLCVKVI